MLTKFNPMKSAEYMMVLRNTDWDEGLSVDQVAETMEKYNAWFERLLAQEIIAGGRPLLAGGRVVELAGKGLVDGPFVESKEVIGGYIVIRAASLEEAAEIAKTFPPLERGVKIELRELAIECPVSVRQLERLAAGVA